MSVEMKRIGDILHLQNGRAFKPAEWTTNGLPIVRIQNLNNSEAPFNHFDGVAHEKFRIYSGDLLFSWSGTPGTSFGAFLWDRGDAWLNQHIFKITFDESFIDKRYLLHAINSRLQLIIDQSHGGVGLKHITKGKLEAIELPIPDLSEQQRIAAILDKADEIRNYTEESDNLRNRFLSSLFLEIFGDTTNEKRYPITTIDENSVTVSKGTTPMTHGMDFVSEGIPFLRVQDLVNNPIAPSFASKAIDESTHDFLSRSQLKPDDILISIAGTIGRISIVPKESPEMNCNQAVAFVRLSETSVLGHCYLMHWLNTRDARLQMAGSAVTATISNLSLGKIRQLKVPVPNLDLQVKFEKICNEFNSMPDYGVRVDNLVNSVTTELLATQ